MDDLTRAVMQALADAFPQVETMTGAEARAAVKAMATARPLPDPPPVGSVEEHVSPSPAGGVPIRVYRPPGAERPAPALVYFHGGGFVIGDVDMYDHSVRELCRTARVVAASVEYRLAPEDPFPAAVEDAVSAVRWTLENAENLGVDPARVGVGGDSAGGNLAAVAAHLLRDEGLALAHQLLIYPSLDPECSGPSHSENAEGYFLTEAAMRWYWAQYLGGRPLGRDPSVAPARSEDLRGLPSATIVVAEYDPCRDDGEAYAAALAAAGVAVDLRRAGGLFHGFFGVAAAIPRAAAFQREVYESVGAALRR